MKKTKEYRQWLIDLKNRIRQSQIKAAVRVNTGLLLLYWDLGQDIVVRQMETAWGSGFFEQLSKDLRSEFPGMQGFSETNLKYCKQFYIFYTKEHSNRQQVVGDFQLNLENKLQAVGNKENKIRHQLGDELENQLIFQIPWGHHIQIFSKCKSVKECSIRWKL